MEYRQFGRTGVSVSPFVLGTMNFGSPAGREDSLAIIERAIVSGINFIDTANAYNKGESEVIVGEALKRMKNRDRIFLATKVCNPMGDGPNDRGVSRLHSAGPGQCPNLEPRRRRFSPSFSPAPPDTSFAAFPYALPPTYRGKSTIKARARRARDPRFITAALPRTIASPPCRSHEGFVAPAIARRPADQCRESDRTSVALRALP